MVTKSMDQTINQPKINEPIPTQAISIGYLIKYFLGSSWGCCWFCCRSLQLLLLAVFAAAFGTAATDGSWKKISAVLFLKRKSAQT